MEGAKDANDETSKRTYGVARPGKSSKIAEQPPAQEVRRSERSTKLQTSRYKDFVKYL